MDYYNLFYWIKNILFNLKDKKDWRKHFLIYHILFLGFFFEWFMPHFNFIFKYINSSEKYTFRRIHSNRFNMEFIMISNFSQFNTIFKFFLSNTLSTWSTFSCISNFSISFFINKEKAKRFVSESVLSNVVGTTDGYIRMLSDI